MTSKEIARKVIEGIARGELKPNDKLMSENQLVIKYNVSRMMASKSYEILKSIGAIYSIPKKGFFITEHFSGLVESTPHAIGSDYFKDYFELIPNWNLPHEVVELDSDKWLNFTRKYFKKKELIAIAHHKINICDINYVKNIPIIDLLKKNDQLIASVSTLKFELFNAFSSKKNLVNTQINYGVKGVVHIAKIVIHSNHFKLVKQESVL